MEVYFKMSRQRTSQFEEETSKIETEYNIQRMESELEYHRKLSKVYENSLFSEQKQLSRIQRRLKRHSQMQNHIRDALKETREDDEQ
jgi:hypothetical protein